MILDGDFNKIPAKLKADWFPTVVANYAVWVPCQFVNFRFVPPHLQVLWANCVGFFWNIYLSYTCYKDKAHVKNVHAIPASHPPTETKLITDAPVVEAIPIAVAEVLRDAEPIEHCEVSVFVDEVPVEVQAELLKSREEIDRLGFEKVEAVDLEATLPPPEVVARQCDDLRGEIVNNLDALIALSVEQPTVERDVNLSETVKVDDEVTKKDE